MGNCLSITLFNFSCEQNLNPMCFLRGGALEKKKLVDFQNDWQRLKAARIDVTNKIEIGGRQRLRPLEGVNHWLSRIASLEFEAEKLIADLTQESTNKCLGRYCQRNYKRCYELRKAMDPMAKRVKELLELIPEVVCESLPMLDPTLKLPTEPTYGLELMIDEVLTQIGDDEKVGMIGLCGMGGVGKTTLLKEINNKLCSSSRNFDLLLWIVISKTPNLTDIQNTIGEKLGISNTSWKSESQEQKALDIFTVLDKKKYIILLDDLWERFDLTKMGIPPPTIANKSKVIFTTRSKVLCGEMKAREIQVNRLTEEESRKLFWENVGEATLNAHPDIPELANVVMKECKNLPLALKVIGRAMTCKTSPASWKLTISSMERNTTDFAGMTDQVFPVLKYSYDNLPNSFIKSCFLYCSLYPEDEQIDKKELIDKWICEGYLDRYNDLYDARYAGYDYISTLVNASLLEECSPESFKLHDVIRDMAIWIGCECGEIEDKFLVQTRCDLKQIPNVVNWGSVERMSFIGNEIKELTEIPHCSKTLTMFLGSNNLRFFSNSFFESLRNIRVLDLSRNRGLRVLPNEICELVNLQYLDLSFTRLEELPVDFKKLVALKYLNIYYTNIINNIRGGELRSCKKLQILHLERHPECGESIFDVTVLKDLDSLECLKDLTLSIFGETSLSEFTSSVKLLSVTSEVSLFYFNDSRCLDFSFLERMERLDSLHLDKMFALEKINVRSEVYLNNLRRLEISDNFMLEDLTWILFAPNIEEIRVRYCRRLKRLVGGSVWDENVNELHRRIPFSKLKILHLDDLPEFESIYPTTLPFPCLSKLEVDRCEKLKKLPFNSNSCDGRQIIIDCYGTNWCYNLEWENEATRTKFSSTFKSY